MTQLAKWPYQKQFFLSRSSGEVTDYPIEMYVGESSGSENILDACESTGSWQAKHNSTITTDTGIVGTNSVKITGTAADSGAYWRPWRLMDLSTITSFKFYQKRSAAATGSFYVFFGSIDSPYNCVRYDYTNTTTWSEITCDRNNYAASSGTIDWSNVSTIRFDVDGNGASLWLDNLRVVPKLHMDGLGKSDFNDLRFVNQYGTMLPYWIFSKNGSSPNQCARIFVKFDRIRTSATPFYMLFGNAAAQSYSNGDNTFMIYDDFERGSNGDAVGNGWTVDGNALISTEHASSGTRSCKGVGRGTSSTMYMLKPLVAADCAYRIQIRFYKEDATTITFVMGSPTKAIYFYINSAEKIYYYNGSSHVDTGSTIGANIFHTLEVKNINFTTNTYDIYIAGLLIKSGANIFNSAYGNILRLQNHQNAVGNDWYVDDIIVANWRPVGPDLGTIGPLMRTMPNIRTRRNRGAMSALRSRL